MATTDLEHWEAFVPGSGCCRVGVESLIGREMGKDARMRIILLKVYLKVLTSEFFQCSTKLNISEAVNITFINENQIRLGGTIDVIVS